MPVACDPPPPAIRQGLLNVPGSTPASKLAVERLLQEDRRTHHCFWPKWAHHNHLSGHLLAAYDLGAPAELLDQIYEAELPALASIDLIDKRKGIVEKQFIVVTRENWFTLLGQERYYARLLDFFSDEVAQRGAVAALEHYLFSAEANEQGRNMRLRIFSGAGHPLIQTGYGAEFGCDALVAQGLAQVAVHVAFRPELFVEDPLVDDPPAPMYRTTSSLHRQPTSGCSLLHIFRMAYDSQIMAPVMPYVYGQHLFSRFKAAFKDGRPEEIRRLLSLYRVSVERGDEEFEEKLEELIWVTTLLFLGANQRGFEKDLRLDFYLMHLTNMTLGTVALVKAIPTAEHKVTLLRTFVASLLSFLVVLGRPQMDVELVMSFSDQPAPPGPPLHPTATCPGNPWPEITASVLHAPDAHTLKIVRVLYYAAQRYGRTPAGEVPGAFDPEGRETIPGIAKVDGTAFVRIAGAVMDTLGWVSHGQEEGHWDRSGLGWREAWNYARVHNLDPNSKPC